MSKSWAWLFLCLSSIACAQSILIPASQCVWRAGDNPAWAASDLDQSGWKPYAQWDFSFNQPRLWIRCKADLPALRGLSDPAVQVSAPAAYGVFLHGRFVGRLGNLQTGDFSLGRTRTWALPREPEAGSGMVAVRLASRKIFGEGPFLNGMELQMEGELPLGAAPNIDFPVSRFSTAEGDALVLVIDGVVEAQNATGELFGFERTTQLLCNEADGAASATAAQQVGQEDDITVLTLTFAPTEVLHA